MPGLCRVCVRQLMQGQLAKKCYLIFGWTGPERTISVDKWSHLLSEVLNQNLMSCSRPCSKDAFLEETDSRDLQVTWAFRMA